MKAPCSAMPRQKWRNSVAHAGPFFRADGIHFMPPGDRFMGDLVSGCIRAALAGAP